MKRASGSAFNLLSVVMLGLTALACLIYTTLFFVPSLAGPFAAPTRILPLALAPSATPTVGLPPTWTPTAVGTPTETSTPIPTYTEGPTETLRPTATRLPTRTVTPTYGPSPTITVTRSKFRYTAEVTYQPAPAYGCGASVILGNITGLDGKPVTAGNMQIRIQGDADIDVTLRPGQEAIGNQIKGRAPFVTDLGASAWDIVLNLSGTSPGVWRVILWDTSQASDWIQIQLQGGCADSSAVVRFQQNH
jgi:hypothetical protein